LHFLYSQGAQALDVFRGIVVTYNNGTHNLCPGSQDLLQQASWTHGAVLELRSQVRCFLSPLPAKELVQIVYDTHAKTSLRSQVYKR
jgi:hypothetical protein